MDPADLGPPVSPSLGPPLSSSPSTADRTPWIIAGSAIVILLAAIGYTVGRNQPAAVVPDMANNGSGAANSSSQNALGPAPDISRLSPRERFDRLYDRIMTAAESGDSASVIRFAPMAFGAYDQLDQVDIDARYHVAMIHLTLGEYPEALALADSIQHEAPNHLFADVLRGEVAAARNDSTGLKQSYARFLRNYAAEMKANRQEYKEHGPVLEDFHRRAQGK